MQPQKEYSGRKVLWGNVVAQKLDTLMVLTFDHLQSCFKSGRLIQVACVLRFELIYILLFRLSNLKHCLGIRGASAIISVYRVECIQVEICSGN